MDEGNKPNFAVNKPHIKRVQVLFTEEQLEVVDAWTVEHSQPSRNDAIRALIAAGINATKEG